jgi:hypothetical protein
VQVRASAWGNKAVRVGLALLCWMSGYTGEVDMSVNEVIAGWVPVIDVPDVDTIVLLYHAEESEPVWPGYFDGEQWRSAEGRSVEPTHWAEMPSGPEDLPVRL